MLGRSSTKGGMISGRWWWCLYIVLLLGGRESRAFMLKPGHAPKLKAESRSWLRPHHMDSHVWKTFRASSFDGGASEMVRDARMIIVYIM